MCSHKEAAAAAAAVGPLMAPASLPAFCLVGGKENQ